jgi:2'-5' RNA ligase
MTIRSFIALPIARETANELGDMAAKMSYQDKSSAVRWVDQGNYHITLAFLGEQEQTDLETLAEQLDYALQQTQFLINLSHPQPFPETRPKLLATMAEKTTDMVSLHQQVSSAINATNLLVDKRKFIPHVTLGRYRHSKNSYAGKIPMNVSFETLIEEVVLYESVLTTSGAEYEPIFRFPLDDVFYDEF